ncbi:MAG: N-acetylmuramoyl-L-alanine amidase [Roseburia sp.]|nr:N-acetylmuramoyl-L-alanine amidase [Roseburia sp.]
MNQKIELFMSIALLCCAVFLAREGAIFVQNMNPGVSDQSNQNTQTESISSTEPSDDNSVCIVIDAGHGGADPGKVGVNDTLEKDINLAIALLLKEQLEDAGIQIILTRDSDVDLSNGASNFKSADMQNRCKLITEANPVFTVSIHQNSYPSENVTGAQVFYYTHSEEGKNLATQLQNSLITNLDPSNKRQPKANDSYYLLKKTPTPTVIVECGFLSSPTEAALLSTTEYQEKVVNAITLGILEYLEANNYL